MVIKVQFNLTNKWLYTLLLFYLVVVASIFVFAYNPLFNKPATGAGSGATFGHSADELVIKMNDGRLETVQNLLKGGGGFTNLQVFSTPGTFAGGKGFSVPASVMKLEVEVVGGGGGGAYYGGAGGGYAYKILNVTPGQNIDYKVGVGGKGSRSYNCSRSTAGTHAEYGGDSSFGSIIAKGGRPGTTDKTGAGRGTENSGGGFSNADIGAYGHWFYDSGWGVLGDKFHGYPSGYPFSRGGGAYSDASQETLNVLPTYGGGGSGDVDRGGGYCGSSGADGIIIVRW